MTNYRRLISYIYAYEGEVKGKNIGFAKLESRNGQCKLSVNVKKVYVGSSDLGVYLLAPEKEIFLGSIFIRSGGGEFRAVVNVENAADSGCSMDQCYGLTIHEQGDTWRAYTTIWEDAVAHAAEVELADVTSSKVGDAEAQIHRKVEELNQELRSGEKAEKDGDGPVLSSSPAEARQMGAAVTQGGLEEASLPRAADSERKDVSGDHIELEPELLPDAEDSMELEQESLPNEMPVGTEEVQESEKTAVLQNKSLAGSAPVEDMEQMDGLTMANAGAEQEPDRSSWNGKEDFGEQQIPQHSWDDENVTSIRKQLYEENETMPRELPAGHDMLDKGAPGQEDISPDTRIPLQPDNMPESRTVPRPNIMTRPGMPRRHMPAGTMHTGSSGAQSDQSRLMMPFNQPIPSRQQPSGSQPPSQGRQSFMGPAGPEGDGGSESAAISGQAEKKIPVSDTGEETLIPGNPQELERLEQEEQQSDFPGRLWDGFRKRYPKIQAFDSANGCEILTIKPQDIGLLPRENWNYGNNSFLLHGYYNYRYLILARIGDETKGRTRYILGVPGNYYSNEKYMASMFGFPHFVLARKQPSQDGRFGYWYTDVRLENQD